jgi:hypothetical protein
MVLLELHPEIYRLKEEFTFKHYSSALLLHFWVWASVIFLICLVPGGS